MSEYSFLGEFHHKVDSKRRVTIPKDFCRQLKDKRLFLTLALVKESPVIAVFPTRESLVRELIKFYNFDYDDVNFRRGVARDSLF